MFDELSLWLSEILNKEVGRLWCGFALLSCALVIFTPAVSWFLCYRTLNKNVRKQNLIRSARITAIFGISLAVLLLYRVGISVGAVMIVIAALGFSSILFFRSCYGIIGLIFTSWASFLFLFADRFRLVFEDLNNLNVFALNERIAVVGACDFLLLGILLFEILTVIFTAYASVLFVSIKSSRKYDEAEQASFSESSISSVKKKLLSFVLIAAVFFVPTAFTDLPSYLTKGSATLSNAYVENINEYIASPEVSKDKNWAADYAESYTELEAFNYRPFSINIRRLSCTNLQYLKSMSQASLCQIWSMSEIDAAIMQGADLDTVLQLANTFDATNDLMLSATASNISTLSALRKTLIPAFITCCIDSFRFYTSFIPLWLVAVLLILMSIGALILYLKVKSNGETTELKLQTSNSCLNISRKNSLFNAVLVVVVVIFVIFAAGNVKKEETYVNVMEDAALNSGSAVLSGMFSDMPKEELIVAISDHKAALKRFIGFEEPEDKAHHEYLSGIASNLIKELDAIETSLKNGSEISRSQEKSYIYLETSLLKESFSVILQQGIGQIFEILD